MKHDTLGYLLALGIPALFVLALLLGGIPAARVVGWCVLGAAGLFYIYTVPPLGGFALAMGAAWLVGGRWGDDAGITVFFILAIGSFAAWGWWRDRKYPPQSPPGEYRKACSSCYGPRMQKRKRNELFGEDYLEDTNVLPIYCQKCGRRVP